MGLTNIFGLKNGTSGWVLAGYELETGADRLDLPDPSPEGLAAAEAYADKLAAEDGVRYMDIPKLQAMLANREKEAAFFVDVRRVEEYETGHIPGFRWFPGGQVVQRSDDVLVVKNCPVVFACDQKARSTFIASWYRQFGFDEVYVVEGGTSAWSAAGLDLEKGMTEEAPYGLAQARERVRPLSPQDLQATSPQVTLFVDTSQDFARGHVPGARWAPRGWLEFHIGGLALDKKASIAVTANDGTNATLAGATLMDLGYENVSVLEGGMAAWNRAGLAVETGLSGVMSPPTDMVLSGPDRNYADMMTYLRWETALGEQFAG
jgi:rhodanese-related sulfurtransferase